MRFFAIILCFFIFACSGKQKIVEDDTRQPETIYSSAQDEFEKGNYKTSAKNFLDVEQQHPYSKLAAKAQVMGAYAYYRHENYEDAINTLDRFIKLNPGNENISYAYYLKALCYYDQIVTVDRDQETTNKARQALQDVVSKFPESDYARDSKLKLDLVEDHLAGKEMTIGRYYLQKKQYVGAINRFKKVVEEYSTTAQVEEALYRLTESYTAIGVTAEAQKYAAVLGHNYPGSKWYQDAYNLLTNGKPAEREEKSTDSWYKIW